MVIRYAFFEGEISKGREVEFRKFVKDKLVPLWTRFPGATEIRVMDGVERDEGAPIYAMALAISYPDLATCKKALESNVRLQSREVTAELLTMFTGRVHHHVFDAHHYEPAKDL